jgi:para-aminobenzoate synthetase/4-amino-4-deoxychorismate lyase
MTGARDGTAAGLPPSGATAGATAGSSAGSATDSTAGSATAGLAATAGSAKPPPPALPPLPSLPAFALLDDCAASAAAPSSRLYTGLSHSHSCIDPADLDDVYARVVADQRRGLHAVVLADYEWGVRLQLGRRAAGDAGSTAAGEAKAPALRFLMFDTLALCSREAVDAWLSGLPCGEGGTLSAGGESDESDAVDTADTAAGARPAEVVSPAAIAPAGVFDITPSVNPDAFDAAIAEIHHALEAGDTYQVNFTYRLALAAFGSPLALYRRLRARQPVHFGALLALPGDEWLLSCSPELFVRHAAGQLAARPMKGTARRSADPHEDARCAAALAVSAKDRAENLMIVDLLRNDVSRVARIGSVRVPALFTVEPYPSVWQMTSSVAAELDAGVDFPAVLRALFPCGSITGAPKHRTMQLIDQLETTPRGIYTGAIGWLDAPATAAVPEESGAAIAAQPAQPAQPPAAAVAACAPFCLSVAIRTLVLGPAGPNGLRAGRMGVGGGIVLDSVDTSEAEECAVKARFLTHADPGFQLFETMYVGGEAQRRAVQHAARHRARLGESAARFGFAWSETAWDERLAAALGALPAGPHRLRVALHKDGTLEVSSGPLAPLSSGAGPVPVLLAADYDGFAPRRADDLFLRHKTTLRAAYDDAWRYAEQLGAFDMLFCNQEGQLTEGGRSNVFVLLDGRWCTPPLESGLLPGVMRAVVLEDPQWRAMERVLTLDDLARADGLMLVNALRGTLPARLVRLVRPVRVMCQ